MTNEFTARCGQYYRLTTRFETHYKRYKNLLNNVPLYSGQHSINELDAMMGDERAVEAARVKGAKIFKELTKTGQTIVAILRDLGVPSRTPLVGEIPGELEFEIWAHETAGLVINKVRDLPPEPEDPNIIRIKCCMSRYGDEEEDF